MILGHILQDPLPKQGSCGHFTAFIRPFFPSLQAPYSLEEVKEWLEELFPVGILRRSEKHHHYVITDNAKVKPEIYQSSF